MLQFDDFQFDNPDLQVQFVSVDEASGMQQQGNSISMDGNEVQRPAAAADTFTWFNLSAGDRPTRAIQLLYATVGRTQNRNTSLS